MANTKFSTSSINQGLVKSRSMLVGNTAYEPPGNFESISTVIVGSGGSSTVTFSSIPQTYGNLQLRFIAKTSPTNIGEDNLNLYFNSDTTQTNYRSHWFYGDGVTTYTSQLQGSGYYIYPGSVPTSESSQASMFGVGIIDILDYTDTNKKKVARISMGTNMNSSGTNASIRVNSGLWNSTSAITAITFTIPGGGNFVQNSKFALYGMKD